MASTLWTPSAVWTALSSTVCRAAFSVRPRPCFNFPVKRIVRTAAAAVIASLALSACGGGAEAAHETEYSQDGLEQTTEAPAEDDADPPAGTDEPELDLQIADSADEETDPEPVFTPDEHWFDVELDFVAIINDAGLLVTGSTNLPEGTVLALMVTGDGVDGTWTETALVGEALLGDFEFLLDPEGGFPSGTYTVVVTTGWADLQPDHIQEVLGSQGENLRGASVGFFEFFGSFAASAVETVDHQG